MAGPAAIQRGTPQLGTALTHAETSFARLQTPTVLVAPSVTPPFQLLFPCGLVFIARAASAEVV